MIVCSTRKSSKSQLCREIGIDKSATKVTVSTVGDFFLFYRQRRCLVEYPITSGPRSNHDINSKAEDRDIPDAIVLDATQWSPTRTSFALRYLASAGISATFSPFDVDFTLLSS